MVHCEICGASTLEYADFASHAPDERGFRPTSRAWALHRSPPMAYFPDATTGVVIGSAIEVHKALGPGLLESAYQRCLAHELTLRRLEFAQQVPLPVFYKGVPIECGYRLDFIVDHRIVVEIKAVESLAPIHRAQILTYLRLLGAPRGLLINFNVPRLVDGVESFLL